MGIEQDGAFKGRHFTSAVILWALRWYLAFPISYRDVVRPGRRGRPHDAFPMGAGLRRCNTNGRLL